MTFDYRSARESIFGSNLPGPLRLVALVLVEYMPNCQPSVTTIASQSGVERKTAIRAIARLERLGVISVDRRNGALNVYSLRPVHLWGTGTKSGPVPNTHGTGTKSGMGPVPNEDGTGTKLGPKAVLSGSESSLKQEERATPDTNLGPVPTAPISHPLKPSKRELAEPTGATLVLRHKFRPDWKPKKRHRARGAELGLTEEQILTWADDCRLKFHKQGFDNEDDHFERALG